MGPLPPPAPAGEKPRHLHILWTNADPTAGKLMVMMYAKYSMKNGWWDRCTVILWGATVRLMLENQELQQEMKALREEYGVALATGQPLPADFIRENKPADPCSQGIKNTFTGIGLFIFLWAITGEFGIGTIGLLVAFMGIGQWIIGYKQKQNPEASDAWMRNINKSENQNDNIKTDSSNIFSPESENKGNGLNEEKPEEEK